MTLALADWQKILIALVLGALFGGTLPGAVPYVAPFGILFLNAIKMLLLPVITTAIINAMLSLQSSGKIKKIFAKACSFYFFSMAVAATFGLVIANWLLPHNKISYQHYAGYETKTAPSAIETFTSLIPANPMHAFVDANILQVVILAVLIGIAINMAGNSVPTVRKFFAEMAKVVFKLVHIVMKLAPYGIFAILANTVAEFGWAIILHLCGYALVTCFAFVMFAFLYYGTLLRVFGKIGFITFLRRTIDAVLLAFTTSSSAAALPVSIEVAEKKLGVDRDLAGFLLPLGSVLNLNGMAIYLTVATVFASHLAGVELTLAQHITVLITIIFTALGAGGIPGSALIVMGAAFTSVGLPTAIVPLLAGIDRFIDMPQTTLNVVSDLSSSYLIARSEGKVTEVNSPTL